MKNALRKATEKKRINTVINCLLAIISIIGLVVIMRLYVNGML